MEQFEIDRNGIASEIDEISESYKQIIIKRKMMQEKLIKARDRFKQLYPIIYSLYVLSERELISTNPDRYLYRGPSTYGFYSTKEKAEEVMRNAKLKDGKSFELREQSTENLSLFIFMNLNSKYKTTSMYVPELNDGYVYNKRDHISPLHYNFDL